MTTKAHPSFRVVRIRNAAVHKNVIAKDAVATVCRVDFAPRRQRADLVV